MKNLYKNFKKNLANVPRRVERTTKGEFYLLLAALFLLPGGSILCLVSLYFKFRNYKQF